MDVGEKPLRQCAFRFPWLIFAAAFAMAGVSCSFDYGPDADQDVSERIPTTVLYGFKHTVVQNGKPLARVSADKASAYDTARRTTAEGLAFSEYDRVSGKPLTEGKAKTATYFGSSGDAEFSGGLRVHSAPDDVTVESGYVYWHDEKRMLESRKDQVTTISRGNGTFLRGAGFSADVATKTIAFSQHADGTVVVEEKKTAEDSGERSVDK